MLREPNREPDYTWSEGDSVGYRFYFDELLMCRGPEVRKLCVIDSKFNLLSFTDDSSLELTPREIYVAYTKHVTKLMMSE